MGNILISKKITRAMKESGLTFDDLVVAENKLGQILMADGSNLGFRSFADVRNDKEFTEVICDKYNLFFSATCSGIMVSNRMRREDNDYKNIAHIDKDNNIKYYEKELPIPVEDRILEFVRKHR